MMKISTGTSVEGSVRNKGEEQRVNPAFSLEDRVLLPGLITFAGTSTVASCTAWLLVLQPKFYSINYKQPAFTNEEPTWNIYKASHYYFFLTET